MSENERMQAVAERIQALVDEFAAFPDAGVQRKAQELVRLLMELYGAGLGRILRTIERVDGMEAGGGAAGALLEDELIASLLVLHDLHPEDRAARITRELERVRQVAGAEVSLVAVADSTARVRVHGQGRARTPPAAELQRLIEEVVRSAAPDVARVEIDGLTAAPPALVQLTRNRPAARPDEAPIR